MNEFTMQLQTLSERLLEALTEKPKESNSTVGLTAWEVKLRLKTSLSQLYMAMGMLVKENRIRIVPDGLTYRIHLQNSLVPPRPDRERVGARASNDALPLPSSSPQGGEGDNAEVLNNSLSAVQKS